MKKQLLALVGLGLMLATISAYAQTGVKANIPFNFVVDKATLPAGEYIVQSVSTSGRAMSIHSADRKFTRLLLPLPCSSGKAAEKTKMVFHRYGNQYCLAQIWTAGNEIGSELPRSYREKEVAMDYTPQNVVVVATLR